MKRDGWLTKGTDVLKRDGGLAKRDGCLEEWTGDEWLEDGWFMGGERRGMGVSKR
jgi:hypothetical protein